MAGKSNTSATFFAQKKLLGKAHTSNLKVDGEELIGSNIQAATSLVFGEEIPTSPSRDLYVIQSASNGAPGSVEYIPFILTVLTGTTYDANSTTPDGGAGSDAGESSQTSGPHTYKFVFPSDYEANSSNSKKGNGFFDNNTIVHETLGKVQLIPPFFSQTSPNPYIVKIYKDNGSGGVGDEIPLLDNIDWNVDYYNGLLFLQDYNSSKIPAHARAFAYVGKMSDEVIASGSSGSSVNNVYSEYVGLANGENTFFSLDHAPNASNHVAVFVNGMLQMPATTITSAPFQDYSITGSNFYFVSSSIPESGSVILANYSTSESI